MNQQRFQVLLLVALLITGIGWLVAKHEHGGQPADEQSLGRIHIDAARSNTVRSPADWHSLYRLPPDRRFLLAFGEIDRLATGGQPQTTSVVFRHGLWEVAYAGKVVGTLPELPTYSDLKQLLEQFAASYADIIQQRWNQPISAAQWKSIEEQSRAFLAPDAFETLRKVDALWRNGERSPRLLRPAARALVYLALQEHEDAGVGDALPGAALADLVLAQSAAHAPMTSEEAFLAYALGYTNAARALAAKLPASDLARAFLLEHQVGDGATSAVQSDLAHYLDLRLATDRGGYAGWWQRGYEDFGARQVPPGILLTGVDSAPINTREELLILISASIKDELRSPLASFLRNLWPRVVIRIERSAPRATVTTDMGIQAILSNLRKSFPGVMRTVDNHLAWGAGPSDFEHLAAGASAEAKGPFLTPASFSAYYRANYYYSLFLLGDHYLDVYDSLQVSKDYGQWLHSGSNSVGDELGRLETLRAGIRTGQIKADELIDFVRSSSHLGALPLGDLVDAIGQGGDWGDPRPFRIPVYLADRLDSRVGGRLTLASAAFDNGRDLHLYHTLTESVVGTASWEHAWTASTLAYADRDMAQIKRMASSENLSWKHQVEVVSEYGQIPQADDAFVRTRFLQLLSEAKDNYLAESDYVGYLESRKDYGTAEQSLRVWLAQNPHSPGLDRPAMFVALARILQKDGKLRAAWDAIRGEALDSNMEGALLRASKILFARGQGDQAEVMATAAVERYPDSDIARANLLWLLWQDGKDQAAAKVVDEAPRTGHAYQWNAFAKAFVRAFRERPDSAALTAFDTLDALPLRPIDLAAFPKNMGTENRPELTFKMFSALKGQGFDRLNELVEGSRYFEAWKGKDAADTWLAQIVQPQARPYAAMMLYTDGQYDASWRMLPQLPPGKDEDFSWLLRAAAYLRSGAHDPTKRQALIDFFSQPGGSYYRVAGRYLMGLAPVDDVLHVMATSKRICELGYYLGIKATADGDYQTASDWFHISTLTGSTHDGEYRWAYSIISEWLQKGLSLKALAMQKEADSGGPAAAGG